MATSRAWARSRKSLGNRSPRAFRLPIPKTMSLMIPSSARSSVIQNAVSTQRTRLESPGRFRIQVRNRRSASEGRTKFRQVLRVLARGFERRSRKLIHSLRTSSAMGNPIANAMAWKIGSWLKSLKPFIPTPAKLRWVGGHRVRLCWDLRVQTDRRCDHGPIGSHGLRSHLFLKQVSWRW